MRRRSTLALVGLATSALLLTACSSSDSGDAESSAAAPAESSAAAPAESAAPASEAAAAPDATGQTLTISNWAGYYPEDLAAQVEAANGTPVTIANHATNEEIMAKLTAGGDSGFDVAFV